MAASHSGVLSNLEIRKARDDGHIVIEPFHDSHLQGSSYDVSLGMYYFRTALTVPHTAPATADGVRALAEDVALDVVRGTCPDGEYRSQYEQGGQRKIVYNFYDQVEVIRYFGDVCQAEPFGEACERLKLNPDEYSGIAADELVIPMAPRERILAHSHEFIGILPPGTTELRARSTTGRNGVTVAKCAGWGDPGYINRWTWEVENAQDAWIFLKAGMRVGQIVFHATGEVGGSYATLTGNYQSGQQLKEVKANWRPADMLPRGKADRCVLPHIDGLSPGLA